LKKNQAISLIHSRIVFLFIILLNVIFVYANSNNKIVVIEDGFSDKTLIVHGFEVKVGVPLNSVERKNSYFYLHEELNGEGFSLQSKSRPNYYLIVENKKIVLSFKKKSNWFKKVSTFKKVGNRIEPFGKPGKQVSILGNDAVISENYQSSLALQIFLIKENGEKIEYKPNRANSSTPNEEKKKVSSKVDSKNSDSWLSKIISVQVNLAKKVFSSTPSSKEKTKIAQKNDTKEEVQLTPMKTKTKSINKTNTQSQPLKVYLETPNLDVLNDFIDTGSITTTFSLLEKLYGKLSNEQVEMLNRQFAGFYQYPADEVKEYFKKLNTYLYNVVALKTRLSVEMENYGASAADALNAYDYQNEEMAKSASKSLLYHRDNMFELRRQMDEINHHLNTLGNPPNALELKKKKEKEFEEMLHLSFLDITDESLESGESKSMFSKFWGSNKMSANSSPLDGVWEIDLNSEVTYAKSSPGKKEVSFKKTIFAQLNKDKPRWGIGGGSDFNVATDVVLEFFNSKKIYLKKIQTLEHGFSYFYLYKYDEDTFERFVIRKIDNLNFELRPITKPTANNYKLKLTVNKNSLDCCLEKFSGYADSDMISYKYKLFRKKTPSNPPTLTNGNWNWDDLEEDFKYELDIYSKLSSQERNIFDLAKIEEDDGIQSIQWNIAIFKKFQLEFDNFISSYDGQNPSTIEEENLIWKLVNVELVKPCPIFPYSVTSSRSGSWVKIWKKVEQSSSAPHNYIVPLNSEENLNQTNKKRLVSVFSWNPPKKRYDVNEKWNINFQKSGSLNAELKINYKTISDNFFKFNLNEDSHEVWLSCKYFYKIQGDTAVDDDFRISYRFTLQLKSSKNNFEKDKESSSEFTWNNLDKEELYDLQIEELTEDIERYKEMLSKAQDIDSKKQLSYLIIGKEADLAQQKDLLAELKTGNFRHTKTKWDNYNADVSEKRFYKEVRDFKNTLRISENVRLLTKKLGKIGDIEGKYIGRKQLLNAIESGDKGKIKKILNNLKNRYKVLLESKQANANVKVVDAQINLEYAERIKLLADIEFMVGTMGMSSGGTLTYAGYSGLTEGIQNGVTAGVTHAITSLHLSTMLIGSAYDGYNAIDPTTGKKAGLEGAATRVGLTLAIVGGCSLALKGVTKACSKAKEGFNKIRDKATASFNKARDRIIYNEEREMSRTLVKRYEARIEKFKRHLQNGENAAAKHEMTLIENETKSLMASPHAKNILKYEGNNATKQYYKYCENKVKDKVIKDYMKRMQKKGWSKFELQEFRNASSGNSVGMDWDIGLIERQGMKLTKKGQKATITMWQKDSEKEFAKAYFKQTGYSAEGSFANITSTVHSESFLDVNILSNPANASKKFADSTAKTVKYKAKFMLSNHSRGFITKTGKYSEACRGMAKEIRSKIIPNLKNIKGVANPLLPSAKYIDYMRKIETVLQNFGENKIGITEAERSIRNLTGKSLSELPEFISKALKSAIIAK